MLPLLVQVYRFHLIRILRAAPIHLAIRLNRICVLWTLILFGHFVFANQVDSLKGIDIAKLSYSAKCNHYLEIVRVSLNEYDSVIKYSTLALDNAVLDDSFQLFWSNFYLGQAYKGKGDFEGALVHYLEAAKWVDSNGQNVGTLNSGLGALYSHTGEMEKAESHYDLAMQFYLAQKTRSDSFAIVAIYNNLGEAYNRLENHGMAMDNYLKANSWLLHLGNEYYSMIINGNIGTVYAKMGEFEKAEKFLIPTINYLRNHGDEGSLVVYLSFLSDVYLHKGENDKSEQYLIESLDISLTLGVKESIRDNYERLYRFEESRSNLGKSLEYFKLYIAYRDSVINAESIRRLADLQTEYQVGLKQAEVDVLTEQRQTQRIVMFGLGVVIFLVIMISLIVYRNYLEKNRINAQLAELNSTKDKFFSIISHDLRGPVNAFHGVPRMIHMALKTNQTDMLSEIAEEVDKSTTNLSDLLDGLLNWAMQQQGKITYTPEPLNVKGIIDELFDTFNNMAQSKQISLVMAVEEHVIISADKNTITTVFRNLINNSLKFTPEEGRIEVSTQFSDDRVAISVADTGVGIPDEKLKNLFDLKAKNNTYGTAGEKGLGLGLQMVKDFVKMNGGTLGVQSEEGVGTTFTVNLPVG
jgi:signal transduction histidine kinase